jgi:hypothetical protein
MSLVLAVALVVAVVVAVVLVLVLAVVVVLVLLLESVEVLAPVSLVAVSRREASMRRPDPLESRGHQCLHQRRRASVPAPLTRRRMGV